MFRMQHLPLVARWSCMCKHRRPADGVKVDPHEALTVSCTTSNHPYTHLTMQGVRYAVVLVALLAHAAAVQGGKIQATFSYKLRGRQTTLAPDGKPGGLALGSQVVMHLDLLDSGDKQVGKLAAHCHVVARQGPSWVSMCTKHMDWADGSTMTAHATELLQPGQPVSARMVIAGGVGRWEGAHGEDKEFVWDPVSGRGKGRIILYCLKGVC